MPNSTGKGLKIPKDTPQLAPAGHQDRPETRKTPEVPPLPAANRQYRPPTLFRRPAAKGRIPQRNRQPGTHRHQSRTAATADQVSILHKFTPFQNGHCKAGSHRPTFGSFVSFQFRIYCTHTIKSSRYGYSHQIVRYSRKKINKNTVSFFHRFELFRFHENKMGIGHRLF